MSQVVIDLPLANELLKSAEPTAMVDSSGQMLGYFVPTKRTLREIYDQAWAEFDREQFDAAVAEGGGRPLEEILRDLEARS